MFEDVAYTRKGLRDSKCVDGLNRLPSVLGHINLVCGRGECEPIACDVGKRLAISVRRNRQAAGIKKYTVGESSVGATSPWREYGVLISALILLGALWGGSFVLQRITAGSFGAFPLVFVRLALGALALSPFLWRVRKRLTRGTWLKFAGVGLLTSAIPFALFAWGAEQAPASVGAITNSLTAPFAALVGWVVFHNRISIVRTLGIFLGFCGVLALVGVHYEKGVAFAALAGTLASLCYAIGGQLVPRLFSKLPPLAIASATLGTGAVLTAGPAIATWPKHPLGIGLWISVAALGSVCTGFAYGLYFYLIARIGAARAATVTYLIPLFAILLAWIFLDEPPTWRIVSAGGLIIIGVLMSQSGSRGLPPRHRHAN